jgi:CheY-like chemotaxis protein
VAPSWTEITAGNWSDRWDIACGSGAITTDRMARQAERPWIVAMTAKAMDSDRQRCLDAGMNAYLAKPIQVEEFVAAVLATLVAAEEA